MVLCVAGTGETWPGLYLNPVSFRREPAFCLIRSQLTWTSVFKTPLHKRARERKRVQGIRLRARAGMLSCRVEPVHTGQRYQQPFGQRQGVRGSTITRYGEWLGKVRFDFCFIFSAQAKVVKIKKAGLQQWKVSTIFNCDSIQSPSSF